MAMSNQRGGGYGSRQHVEKPIRTGTGSRSANPGGVGQIGNMQGNHVTSTVNTDYRGDRIHGVDPNFQPVKFGNEVALNVGKGGCGTGRTIYGCGTQGTQGATNPGSPTGRGRGILTNE
jgi:hypothetical protein